MCIACGMCSIILACCSCTHVVKVVGILSYMCDDKHLLVYVSSCFSLVRRNVEFTKPLKTVQHAVPGIMMAQSSMLLVLGDSSSNV